MNHNIITGFIESALNHPEKVALEVEGQVFTYKELRLRANRIANALAVHKQITDNNLTAVFAYRTAVAFSGVIGSLLGGSGYVPLNRTFPIDRTRTMLERSRCQSVIVDTESAKQLDEVLTGISRPLVVLLPDTEDTQELETRWPMHKFIAKSQHKDSSYVEPSRINEDDIAYLLFTSGSTGQPKGVMVSHKNVASYLKFVVPRYRLTSKDRCSQTFDMTFDLSVHDMFVTWQSAACLCCPTQKALIKPGAFIQESNLTVWFSVPSTLLFMKRLGGLKENSYPQIRLSLFCGEALPAEVVRAWSAAAPNSIIENIYGPTELTIACTAYRWNPETSPGECELGLVPIGEPMAGMNAKIVDESLNVVPDTSGGELVLTGPQLSLGYWQDSKRTAKSFVNLPGLPEVYYRTGDRVKRSSPLGPLVYLGRLDNQIKIMGHRVELGEVEAVVREESGIDGIVAVGWPPNPGGAGGVEVFLQSDKSLHPTLKDRVAQRLPAYMVPRRFHLRPQFPLNANGKFDRNKLTSSLEDSK